jgi:hypothetical protein
MVNGKHDVPTLVTDYNIGWPENSIATAFAELCAPLDRIKRSDFAMRSIWATDAGASLLDGLLRAGVPCA